MVRHNDHESINSSSKHPTIDKSMMCSAAPLHRAAHNLNPNFNEIRLHIIVSQCNVWPPKGCPLHFWSGKELNMQNKPGLPLQNLCVLSDQQAIHHHFDMN
jgi:hypothetical protein